MSIIDLSQLVFIILTNHISLSCIDQSQLNIVEGNVSLSLLGLGYLSQENVTVKIQQTRGAREACVRVESEDEDIIRYQPITMQFSFKLTNHGSVFLISVFQSIISGH